MADNEDMGTTTEGETTEPETTEEEDNVEPLPDQELEIFRESLQGKSKATITSYTQAYLKMKKALGKDLHDTSEKLLIKTAEQLTTNLNSQAAYINIGFLIRKQWNQDVRELVKARQVKKQSIIEYTREENAKAATNMPSVDMFDKHIDFLYDHKMYREFIINYLIRNCHVRNQDLLFEVIRKRADAVGEKNFMWLPRGNRVVYIRRAYKTKDTYGEKVTEFKDPRLAVALRSLKNEALIPTPSQVGYYVKKLSFQEMGEGALLKMILNETRTAGDWHQLNKISSLRGTDVCTLTTSYNIQKDSDEGKATIKKGRKKN